MKHARILVIAVSAAFLAAGCTQEGKQEGHAPQAQHQNHENHGEHQSAAPAAGVTKEVQIFENGRVILFEETPPVLRLTDQEGREVTNETLKGKTVLINFIYTRCDESCPIMIHKFMDIAREMKDSLGKGLILVSITMDPEYDSPEVLKKYAEKIGADTSTWTFLTGGKETVDQVLKGFNFFVVKNDDGSFGHANAIVMLDKRGVWRYNFNVLTVPVDILVDRVKKEI